MTKQQFDDLYLGKAVHCDTEEKANKFLELAHSVGYEWASYNSLLGNTSWDWYKKETCYKVNSYGITFADDKFYKKSGYTIVKFELEKENNMKFKVGQQVRVRSDLVVDKKYGNGYLFNRDMSSKVGLETTVTHVIDDECYLLKDVRWHWTDEMLEPVTVETFNVGDVVYDNSGQRLEVIGFGVKVRTKHGVEFYRPQEVLTQTKPLQKITRKELAEKSYELVE